MSDDEEVMHEEEEEEGEEEPKTPTRKVAPVEDSGPSEAELAMQKRRAAQTAGLDEDAEALLEENRAERQKMEEEIQELRERNERRKREREEEERAMTVKRAEEERARRAEEEERKRKKEEDEMAKREERALKMAEFEKWKNPPKANFVITKRDDGASQVTTDDGEGDGKEKKSREQLEAEKKAILSQRIKPLEISGLDQGGLKDKAKELLNLLYRLESERYDLEKRFKAQQYDMTELAERARQHHKVGKAGTVKRVNMGPDETDKMQERFAGCPTKIVMYSEYERQKDKRAYEDRQTLYTGPQFLYPAEKIKATKIIRWGEDGLPIYEEMEGAAPAEEPAAQEAGGEEE